MTFAHADPIVHPVPVVPTQHYMMGGIPANIKGQVISLNDQRQDQVVPGLYAIGECACVSVHGANRLGGNSLLDLVVFGRAAGAAIIEELSTPHAFELLSDAQVEVSLSRLNVWASRKGPYTVPQIRHQVQSVMQKHFLVYREDVAMRQGLKELLEIHEKMQKTQLSDHSKIFNTARLEALECDNLLAIALATAYSAIARTESRGAHARKDYPNRDDKNWLKHIVCFQDGRLEFRTINMTPQTVPAFEPKARVY
jgi:succinate dehydrogenase / fumarate reductase flavoprotein subunit